jgi:vancomycin resistance protein VanJ
LYFSGSLRKLLKEHQKSLESVFSMSRIFRFIRNAITLIAILYLLTAVGLFLTAFFVDSGVAGVLRNFLVTGLLASPLFLFVMLMLRRWRIALALVLPVAGLVLVHGRSFVPRAGFSAPENAVGLTVLTFNLGAVTTSLDSVVEIVEDSGADVVALQELSRGAAAYLDEQLAERYPYRALYPQDNPIQGQGVLSVYPIEDETFWINEELVKPLAHLRVELALNEQTLALYNTHPTPPFSIEWGLNSDSHSAEIEELLQRADRETVPVLLIGDFNFTDQFKEYDRMTGEEGYTDAFREAGSPGFGFTYPDSSGWPLPIMRLDHLFRDANFQTVETYVLPRSGIADHRPIFAHFVLVNPD